MKISSKKVFWLSLLSATLLVLSGLSYWLSSTIFNQDVFVRETVKVMTAPQTTDGISREIVDRALEEKPVLKNIIGNKLESIIGGLLNTDTFADVVRSTSGKIYLQITAKNPEGVVINTEGVKSFIKPVATIVSPSQKEEIEKMNIPDEITLISPNSVPSIYYLTNYLWIYPFALAAAIGLIAYLVYNSEPKNRLNVSQRIATIIAATLLIAAAVIPSIEPLVIRNINSYNLKIVASSIYEGLSSSLVNLYLGGALLGFAVIAGTFGYNMYITRRIMKLKK